MGCVHGGVALTSNLSMFICAAWGGGGELVFLGALYRDQPQAANIQEEDAADASLCTHVSVYKYIWTREGLY